MLKFSRKGQIEHAFTMIIFILVAALVMIVGYKAIGGLVSDSCSIEKTTFQQDIVGYFEKYDGYGSVHKEQIKLPCGAYAICFVDADVNGDSSLSIAWSQDPLLAGQVGKQNVINSARDAQVNIFVIGEFAEPMGYSDKVKTSTGLDVCFESKGTVDLTFRGEGRRTLVEES